MKPLNLFLTATIFCGVLLTADFAPAQDWYPLTNAPSNNWASIASSADGSVLIIGNVDMYFTGDNYVFDGSIYISTNSGAEWTQAANAPPAGWIAVASSADGKKLVSLPAGGPIYASSYSGKTWAPMNTPSSLLNCLALSADGTKLTAGEWNDFPPNPSLIFTTTNSGVSWDTNNSPNEYWTSIASSADGRKLIAVGTNPTGTCHIFTSLDGGITWNMTSAPKTNWYAVAASADGEKLIAAVSGGQVYISDDGGINWTPAILPIAAWDAVACSAGRTKLMAGENYGGTIYTSTNSGADWIPADVPAANWRSAAFSADGNNLVAVSFQGVVYTLRSFSTPQLSIARPGGNVTLSWLIQSKRYEVQENSDLTTTNWMTLTNTPTLNLSNLNDEVVLSPSNSSGFFRLMSQ